MHYNDTPDVRPPEEIAYNMDTATSLPQSGALPKNLVILLHGLGSNGEDLMSLVPFIRDALPEATAYLSPHAPFACDMAPVGYQWFSLQTWTEQAIQAGVDKAAPILRAYIYQEAKRYDVPLNRVALVGFSQGTMMALRVGLEDIEDQLACIIGFSGALVGANNYTPKRIKSFPPVHLIHGMVDHVVPYVSLSQAENALRPAGVDLETTTCPLLGHSIDEQGLRAAQRTLQQALGQNKSST